MLASLLLLAAASAAPYFPTPPRLPATARAVSPRAPSHQVVLFLNFGGGTLMPGNCSDPQTNCSFIIGTGGPVQYPPFHGSAAQKQLILELVKGYFDPFNVQIVTERPASGPYDMNMVGGQPSVIGVGAGAVGIAPLDCGNTNDGDLSFTFADVVGNDPIEVAQTIAQESAHGFGLGHTNDRSDVMYPVVERDATGFQDLPMHIFDVGGGSSDCSGTGVQNSFQMMLMNVGAGPPDTMPPTVSFLDPMAGATLASGFSVSLDASDDRALRSVELWVGDTKIGGKLLPPYDFTIQSGTFPGGPLQLRGIAIDRGGNQTELDLPVTLKKLGETPGDLGTPCTQASDCNGGGSCQAFGGHSVCTRVCSATLACPNGFDCQSQPTYESYCVAIAKDEGCTALPASRRALPVGALVLAVLWFVRRRARDGALRHLKAR